MRFRDIGNCFKVRMKREDGTEFFGQLSLPTMSNNRTTDFSPTRRQLRVDDAVKLSPGVIFFTPKKEAYLTAYNGENEYIRSDLNTFIAIHVTREMRWTRVKTKTNPVTGLQEGTEEEDLGLIWTAFETDGQTEDTLNVVKKDFRIVTNVEVLEGDYIGKYRALRVDYSLGVYIVHV